MSSADELGFPVSLLTSAELPAIDRHMAETGTSGYVLMERAGAAVAREVAKFAPDSRRIVVVSGPNNNGGDCICAARILRDNGRDVTLALFAEPAQLPKDPAKAASTWNGPTVAASPSALDGADLIVDGLYGGGVKHDITGDAAAIVSAINASPARVLSVDFPTGISGVTGAVLGTAVRADRTITFFCLKPGQLLVPGRSHCGPVVVDSIGIPPSVMDTVIPKAFHNRPGLWRSSLPLSVPSPARVLVGSSPFVAAGVQAVGAASVGQPKDAQAMAGVDGSESCAGDVPIAISAATIRRSDLARLRGQGRPVVLVITGERFAGMYDDVSGASMLERVKIAAEKDGVIVVHLGADRIVAAPDGRGAISNNAPEESVTEELCDIVTGSLAGLLGRRMPSFEAAAAATWLLGQGQSTPAADATSLASGISKALLGIRELTR